MPTALKWTLCALYLSLIALIVHAANQQQLPGLVNEFLTRTPGADKACHFLLVGGTAAAVNWLLNCRTIPLAGREIQLGTLLCLLLATLEELSQIWNPNRTADWMDFAMNTLGILLIGPLARRLPRSRPA